MIPLYDPCSCKSGKKYKFCCYKIFIEKNSSEIIKVTSQWPVYQCWTLCEENKSHKITVFVAKTMPNGNYTVGSYLLDLLCLGLKDAFISVDISKSTLAKYEILNERITKEFISYQDARSLILGAIAFAKKNGYAPHEEWEESKCLIDPHEPYEVKFTFGFNGKAIYVPSINDAGFKETPNGKQVIMEYVDQH